MSVAESGKIEGILHELKNWPPASKIVLARRILETLEPATESAPPRNARSVQELIGLGVVEPPAPPDETDAPPPTEQPFRGVPVESVVGLLRTYREPPSDEECRQIVEEERWKKYGR